ncbi:YraN family protein [bacterium]|nr:YraN family protein [bacterium]MBU1651645.1 YraN family protein [bacterium]MBU1880581.1 YraN family protein [bacterium]
MPQNTHQIGDSGEDLAVEFLRNNGFEIVARNFRKRFGEVDIIARSGEVLVFCEVKRSRFSGNSYPELRVDHKKQVKLARTAQAFLTEYSEPFEEIRFDIITVENHQGRSAINHIENAFWPPDGWDEIA